MRQNNSHGVIFLASVLGKMSQMFSEINSIYLQAMMDKKSLDVTPGFSMNTLFHEFQKENLRQLVNFSNLEDILSSEEDDQIQAKQEIQEKPKDETTKTDEPKQSTQIQVKKTNKTSISPPHPPPSSYLLFFNEHRQKIAEQFPKFNVTQLSKIASKCWKDLTQEEKKPYHERFNEEKKKYYEALKIYNEVKGDFQITEPQKKVRKARQPKKPKEKIQTIKQQMTKAAPIQEQPKTTKNSDQQNSDFSQSFMI